MLEEPTSKLHFVFEVMLFYLEGLITWNCEYRIATADTWLNTCDDCYDVIL